MVSESGEVEGEDMHVGSGGGPDTIQPTPASSSQPPTIVSMAGSSDAPSGKAAEHTPQTSPRPGVNDAGAMRAESETPANPARSCSPTPPRKGKDPVKRRYVQTILDTTGAAWSRKVSLSSHGHRGGEGERRGEGEPPRKKLCTENEDDELNGGSVGAGEEPRTSASEGNSLERLKAKLKLIGSNARGSSEEDIGRGVADGGKSMDSRRTSKVDERLDAGSSSAKGNRTRPAEDFEPEGENMEIDELADTSIMLEESDVDDANKVIDISDDAMEDEVLLENGTTDVTFDEFVSRPEIVRTSALGHVLLRFDLSRISDGWHRLRERLPSALDDVPEVDGGPGERKVPAEAGVSNVEDNSKAADALSRVIGKEDFEKMEVVGQFNLGFIVARRRKMGCAEGAGMMDDLFIVDQHAADEKYNFETLQQTTRIRSQTLLR
jgi:DNA mismatch repair protein PMS2